LLLSKILAPHVTNHVSIVEEKTNRERIHIKVLAILNQRQREEGGTKEEG